MNKILFFLEKYLAALAVLILGYTFRFEIYNRPKEDRYIYIFWHRNMIPLLFLHRFEGKVIMISNSKDGELIAGPARVLGFRTARGSSRKGSSKAIRDMIKLSRDHSLAVTPDGPKGPRYTVKPGLLNLAYVTKLPLIPVVVDIKTEKIFNSWDRFRLPFPFSRINVGYGDPIQIKEKPDPNSTEMIKNIMKKNAEKNKIK